MESLARSLHGAGSLELLLAVLHNAYCDESMNGKARRVQIIGMYRSGIEHGC